MGALHGLHMAHVSAILGDGYRVVEGDIEFRFETDEQRTVENNEVVEHGTVTLEGAIEDGTAIDVEPEDVPADVVGVLDERGYILEGSDADESYGDDPVDTLKGIGPAYSEQLAEHGIETVEDVLEVGVEGLVEAGLSQGKAENVVGVAGN